MSTLFEQIENVCNEVKEISNLKNMMFGLLPKQNKQR